MRSDVVYELRESVSEKPMRRNLVVAAIVGALAIVASAGAKEPKSLAICGVNDCTVITGKYRIEGLVQFSRAASWTPSIAPFYALETTIDADSLVASRRMYYLPSAGMARTSLYRDQARWGHLTPESQATLEKLTAKLAPFPPPRLTSVTVGGTRVEGDLSTYLRLFSLPLPDEIQPNVSDWVPLDFRSERASPWTDRRWDLGYSRDESVLYNDAWVVPLPDNIADDVAAARALTPHHDDGFPLITAAAIAVLSALGLAGILVLLRRRPSLEPQPRSK